MVITGRDNELLVWSPLLGAPGRYQARLTVLQGDALAAVTAAASDARARRQACAAAAATASVVPWAHGLPKAAVFEPTSRKVVSDCGYGRLVLLDQDGGVDLTGPTASDVMLATDGKGGVYVMYVPSSIVHWANMEDANQVDFKFDLHVAEEEEFKLWTAFACDTQRSMLYAATHAEVYRTAVSGRGSVRRFDAPAAAAATAAILIREHLRRNSGRNSGRNGGGSDGMAPAPDPEDIGHCAQLTDVRCLRPLPGGAGLLLGDGPHLRRIDPDGTVRTLLPHALRSAGAAAADSGGGGDTGGGGGARGVLPLTSLAFVSGPGGGTVVVASAGCAQLLLCSAAELSQSYSQLAALAELRERAATAAAFSTRLLMLRLPRDTGPSPSSTVMGGPPAAAAAAAAAATATAATASVHPATVVVRVCAGSSGSSGGGRDTPAAASTAAFLAHRAVLAALSDFFKQLLAGGGGGGGGGGGFAEAGSAQVDLRDAEPDVFARLLGFMYTGSLGDDLDSLQPAQLKAVAELAGRLLLPDAVALLQPRLLAAAVAAPEAAVAVLGWAARHSLTGLVGELAVFVATHAGRVLAVTPREDLAALAAAQPELAAVLMQAVAAAGGGPPAPGSAPGSAGGQSAAGQSAP